MALVASVNARDARVVLVLNSGSSSLKWGVYRAEPAQVTRLLGGELRASEGLDLSQLAATLPALQAVAHRFVHGGPGLCGHAVITAGVMQQLEAAQAFAPLHTPAALKLLRAAQARFPGVPQLACLDTAFHANLPETARVLPVPQALRAQGIQRFGFHGLSCESVLHQVMPSDRMLIAHLGHGASVTAVQCGQSVDTSMGLTPSGGVMMGTRSGDLDPGLLIYLLREKGYTADQIEALVDQQSGLLGVSGLSSDMRRLHAAEPTQPDARLAVNMFCIAVSKQLAAMATVLGGVDRIVFTGGVGENDAAVRALVCQRLAWCGVQLDAQANQRGLGSIHHASSRCAVQVVACQEAEQMARHALRLLGDRSLKPGA